MSDVGLPQFLGNIGHLSKFIYPINSGDKNIFIADALKEAQDPVVIYSSGVNNLMREVGANPFNIKSLYEKRDTLPNYNYTLEKTKDPDTLNRVIDSMKRNFENILSINGEADIYTLGAYVPKSLEIEEMNIFRELVLKYNDVLKQLCRVYQIYFVDTEEVGKKYNTSLANFHVSTIGHFVLADYILGYMYYNKINRTVSYDRISNSDFCVTNGGLAGIFEDLYKDYDLVSQEALSDSGFSQKRLEDIGVEHYREIMATYKGYKKSRTLR